MTAVVDMKPEAAADALPCAHLNRDCFCIALDRAALDRAIERQAGDPEFRARYLKSRPNLFSNVPVFLAASDIAAMHRVVRAIEAATRLQGYRDAALAWAPQIATRDFGPRGAFMGYDFHLAPEGPRLIEINTNAGGGFLNALLADAQRGCCAEVEAAFNRSPRVDFETAVLAMFQNEWRLQGRSGAPTRIAIVDDAPEEQYLYPEFVLAQRFFEKHGIEAVIADPKALHHANGRLSFDGKPIDLVYNRVVDFALERPEHASLRAAYLDGSAVVTPNPRTHALFADKRNMTLLSNQAALRGWGLSEAMLTDLAQIPRTVLVTAENAEALWQARRTLFFKPAAGYGSKAVYRGDKLTKGVWAQIARGGYVAQEFASPSERMVPIDGTPEARKLDIRLYVYDGEILIAAARLYQGQTTNFRTAGGGFAPVFAI